MFKKLAIAAVAGTFAVAAPAAAQSTPPVLDNTTAVDQDVTAKVKLWSALSFQKGDTDMYFGAIVRATDFTSDTVTLGSDGSRTCGTTGKLTCSDTPTNAVFTLKADDTSDVQVVLSGDDFTQGATENTVRMYNGANWLDTTIELSGTGLTVNDDDSATYDITGSGSDQTITAHGVLTVKPVAVDPANPDPDTDAPNGVYSGSYTVTAQYV